MKRFRWGIFGTGAVSMKFAAGLAASKQSEIAFVASRNQDKAERFARAMGIPSAISPYQEAVRSAEVDAVYIATPPALHRDHALMCIEAGLPVLVEKPLATNGEDARQIADAARRASVFAMEAFWTRFLPAAQALKESVAKRKVGDVRIVSGNFGTSQLPRAGHGIFTPELGGGALSHLAPYPLLLSQWLFGSPTQLHAMGTLGTEGVDESVTIQARYPGDILGSFFVSVRAWGSDSYEISGTHGTLSLGRSIVRPNMLHVIEQDPRDVEEMNLGFAARLRENGKLHAMVQRVRRFANGQGNTDRHYYAGNGYHYEADEVRRCVERGAIESETMPLSDSVAVADQIEALGAMVRARVRAPG